MHPGRAIAERFAHALDADDFTTAGRLLAEDCSYDTGKDVLVGREPIIHSYRENSEWARRVLDAVEFESHVERASPETFFILFTDRIQRGTRRHEYRCRQLLKVDEQRGLITHIVHQNLEGEQDRLRDFFAQCGITRAGT